MYSLLEEPALREERPAWQEVPAAIIIQLQNLLKEEITGGDIAWGGYSPTAAFTVTLKSGRKVFTKGTHPKQETHGTQMLRQEIGAYQASPAIAQFSPPYLGCVSDGSEDGWMLGAFEYIETSPTLPWTPEKLDKVFAALAYIHRETAPALPGARQKNYVEKYLRPEGGWLRLRTDVAAAEKFITIFEDGVTGSHWFSSALPVLCDLQNQAAFIGGVKGTLHLDLRSDNILFDKNGRVFLVDWPNACYGPAVLDMTYFLASVCSESAFNFQQLLDMYAVKSGLSFSKKDAAVALASLSGHTADMAYRAVPARLPRLRWMQKSMLWAMLQAAVPLIGSPPPPRFKGLKHD